MGNCRKCTQEIPQVAAMDEKGEVVDRPYLPLKHPPFCPQCGAFQFLLVPPNAALHRSAVQFKNPVEFIAQLPEVGSPPSLAARLSMRDTFERALEGSPFCEFAFDEYEKVVEPLVNMGRADAEFVSLLANFWSRTRGLAQSYQALIDQAAKSATANPRLATLFEKLRSLGSSTQKLAMLRVTTDGSSYPLYISGVRLEWALGECQQAAYRIVSYIRSERAKHIGSSFNLPLEDDARVRELQIQYQMRQASEYWIPNEIRGVEILQRFHNLCADAVELVQLTASEVQMLDWKKWFLYRSMGMTQPFYLAGAVHIQEHLSKSETSIEEEIAEGERGLHKTVQSYLDRIQVGIAAQEARDEHRRKETQMANAVDELVRQQQAARQLAEGKFGSAWMTATVGTAAGAAAEGVGAKK